MFAIITYTNVMGCHKELVIGQEQAINGHAVSEASSYSAVYDINLLGYNLPANFNLSEWDNIKNLFQY